MDQVIPVASNYSHEFLPWDEGQPYWVLLIYMSRYPFDERSHPQNPPHPAIPEY